MLKLKVIFDDGDYLITKFNLSLEEAKNYYIGNRFNLGIAEDNFKKCIDIIEL